MNEPHEAHLDLDALPEPTPTGDPLLDRFLRMPGDDFQQLIEEGEGPEADAARRMSEPGGPLHVPLPPALSSFSGQAAKFMRAAVPSVRLDGLYRAAGREITKAERQRDRLVSGSAGLPVDPLPRQLVEAITRSDQERREQADWQRQSAMIAERVRERDEQASRQTELISSLVDSQRMLLQVMQEQSAGQKRDATTNRRLALATLIVSTAALVVALVFSLLQAIR